MPVYLPTAIVGNSRVLATIGASGELMAFFYPRIDWAQNVHEAMVYLVIDAEGEHYQNWTFDHVFERHQRYLPGTTALETVLTHRATGLTLTQVDWVAPSSDSLLRRFEIRNPDLDDLDVRVYQYLNLNLGEVAFRNAVRYLPQDSMMIQQWHEFCFALGGDRFDAWQCGKADQSASSNAKNDLMDGWLNGQSLDIGDVDCAAGWWVHLDREACATRYLCIVPEKGEPAARKALQRLRNEGFDHIFEGVHDPQALHRFSPREASAGLPEDLRACCERALLILPLLFDQTSGACLAAPEFDPCFVQSGGYGYCWPRDAAVPVLALLHAGMDQYAEPFFKWCRASQAERGFWHQRYWLNGDVGPSWCTPDSAIQIDQTGSVLHAMSGYCDWLPERERSRFATDFWETIRRAAEYLAGSLTDTGLHETAFDLWETFRGTFLYSNASLYAALTGAARMAREIGETERASQWEEKSAQLKVACLSRFWNGRYFLRGLNETCDPESVADSSVLGALVPFELLDLSEPSEKGMLESTLAFIRERLEIEVPGIMGREGGPGIRRYEYDSYAGGPAAAVNTLWMALALLRVAEHELSCAGSQPVSADCVEQARAKVELAMRYMRTCVARATPTGLLPELMGGPEGAPYWAAPHAWGTGWYIECCLSLRRIGKVVV